MKYGDFDIRIMERKRSVMINVRRESDPHSCDMVIHKSLLGIASAIIDAVNKEKEEANG